MKALILAAGYGTRLHPLTLNKPKSLLSISGKLMIEHILKKVEEIEEVDEVYIVTNEKFAGRFHDWNNNYSNPKKIKIINDGTTSEENKLGAIGDIQLVLEQENIRDGLLVVAGDNLFDFKLENFVNFFKKQGSSVGLYDIKNKELVKNYGVVEINQEKQILSFEEKPEEPRTTLIAIGLYFFPAEKLKFISQYLKEGNNPDAPGFYIAWLSGKEPVYGFVLEGKWYDIGDFKSYQMASKEYGKSLNKKY